MLSYHLGIEAQFQNHVFFLLSAWIYILECMQSITSNNVVTSELRV